jgi:hypothetical protein
MQLIYGERYRIRRTNNEIIEGTHIQTKGDDENYPTFELGTGGRIGVHRDAVLGLASDDAPHSGIPRLVAIDSDADGKHIHFSAIDIALDVIRPDEVES